MTVDPITRKDLFNFYQQPWECYWLDKVNAKLEPVDPLYRRLMTAIFDFVESPRLVLDVACGIGLHVINLSRLYPKTQFFAADISYHQLKIGRELAISQNLDSRIKWLCSDIQHLPFNFQPDHILCTEVLEHLLDPATALAGLRRLCGPETRVILAVPQIYGPTGMDGVFYKQVLPDTGAVIETQDPTHLHPDVPVYKYYHAQYTKQELTKLLRAAGFRIETIRPVVLKIPLHKPSSADGYSAVLVRRVRNGLSRALYRLVLNQPSRSLDTWLCDLSGGVWAENLVAVCRAA